jgi:DNA-binding transcriptional LysR family regulator
VSPTEAGERLLQSLGPHLDGIDAGLASLTELREKPAGTIRINADEHAVNAVLWPALRKVLPDYPEITVELVTDFGMTDIVAERFDAGVRLGEVVAKDMVAVSIGPDMRMAAVGAPAYFARWPPPRTPQDLTTHICINLRLPTHGGLYAWEFEEDGREIRVRVEGQVVFNTVSMILQAALDGFGIAYLPQSQVQAHLDTRRARVGAGGLEPAVPRLPPVLPEPASAIPRLCRASRGVAPPITSSITLSLRTGSRAWFRPLVSGMPASQDRVCPLAFCSFRPDQR